MPRLTIPNAAISTVVSSSFRVSSRSWAISGSERPLPRGRELEGAEGLFEALAGAEDSGRRLSSSWSRTLSRVGARSRASSGGSGVSTWSSSFDAVQDRLPRMILLTPGRDTEQRTSGRIAGPTSWMAIEAIGRRADSGRRRSAISKVQGDWNDESPVVDLSGAGPEGRGHHDRVDLAGRPSIHRHWRAVLAEHRERGQPVDGRRARHPFLDQRPHLGRIVGRARRAEAGREWNAAACGGHHDSDGSRRMLPNEPGNLHLGRTPPPPWPGRPGSIRSPPASRARRGPGKNPRSRPSLASLSGGRTTVPDCSRARSAVGLAP